MRVRYMLATLSAITVSFSAAADKPPLSLDFLEYLGGMVEHEGQLLDAMDMEAEDVLNDPSLVQTGNGEQAAQSDVNPNPKADTLELVP